MDNLILAVYFIDVLGTLGTIAECALIISMIVLSLTVFLLSVEEINGGEFKKHIKTLVPYVLIFTFLSVFIPDKKTMYTMVGFSVVTKIAKDKQVSGKVNQLINTLLKKLEVKNAD